MGSRGSRKGLFFILTLNLKTPLAYNVNRRHHRRRRRLIAPDMLSLLLPAVASTNVSLAILIRHSDARSTSHETCAGEWINGACWMTDTMQTVVAASLTAVTDFNARNASALPAFGNLAGCDKQLRFRLLDSGGTVAKSVRALGDLTSGTDVVIGPGRSSVSTTTAAITGALDIPQISYWSTSTDLDDIALYPRFMRTIPTDQAAASSVCSFWKRQLGLSTVAVLYVQDPFGRAYEEATKVACLALGLTFASEGFSEDESLREKSIRDAVESLSDSGAKALLVLGFPSSLGLIVDSALATGLLSAGTSWVFADSVVSVNFDELSEAAQDALHGSLQIKAVGATDGDPQWTRFANERWAALQPGDFNPHLPADWQIRDDFFTAVDPHTSAILREPGAFAYDAVVTAGLLSCQAAPAGPLPDSFGTQFWNSKQSLSFDGLSGRVELDEKGDRGSANVQLFNLLGQGATAFSAQLVAQFIEDEWVWKGGSREHSGVMYNFGELEPPVEALPPTQDEVSPYLIGIVCALAGCVALMLCLRCQSVGWLVPPLSRIAASHGTSPWTLLRRRIARSAPVRACADRARAVRRACSRARTTPFLRPIATPQAVWERLCRRANKEPTEGPPDVERRPFVEQRLWASVLEQKLWGSAAREAAQLREWLHATRNTTPFIEALASRSAACTHRHGGCGEGRQTDSSAHADLEAGPRLTRTTSFGTVPIDERANDSLSLGDLLRFCLNEQGAGGRTLWEEWTKKKLQVESSKHRDSASRHAPRSVSTSALESEPISVHEFAELLLSPSNSAIEPRRSPTDATEPLTSYWISSSHNSFLEGDQLTSVVSADMYRRLLLSGTRCLEIDCWDPTTFGRWWGQGPRVTHRMPGGVPLLCGSVAFGEVVAAIAEHAFTSSPLPVILSLEMHCSAKQQRKIAKELINTLGDQLSRSERVASTPLRELHRKVLVKMRLDKGGVTTDPLLRSLVTLPTSSIGRPPPEEDDSGRRLDRKASWTELSGRYLHQFGDESDCRAGAPGAGSAACLSSATQRPTPTAGPRRCPSRPSPRRRPRMCPSPRGPPRRCRPSGLRACPAGSAARGSRRSQRSSFRPPGCRAAVS